MIKQLVLAAVLSALAAPAWAQSAPTQAKTSAKFIEMDGSEIGGRRGQTGDAFWVVVERPHFAKLLKLKKVLRPALHQTAGDRDLR